MILKNICSDPVLMKIGEGIFDMFLIIIQLVRNFYIISDQYHSKNIVSEYC